MLRLGIIWLLLATRLVHCFYLPQQPALTGPVPPIWITNHHHQRPPVLPSWIIHRIKPKISTDNPPLFETTTAFPREEQQTTTKSVPRITPITTKSVEQDLTTIATRRRNVGRRLAKKVGFKFTEEQRDMNKPFVVVDHYNSEEVTDAAPTTTPEPTTTTPTIDSTIEFVPPYISTHPVVYYYYY